jgi:iron complex outermembrane recepter protein
MRIAVIASAITMSAVGLTSAADVQAAMNRVQTNIPAEALGPALRALASEYDFQIVYASQDVSSLHTEGAVGEFTATEALTRLLNGTGLTYRYLDEKTVTIVALVGSQGTTRGSMATDNAGYSTPPRKEGSSAGSSLHLAQAAEGQTTGTLSVTPTQSASHNSSDTNSLEEVVVTAQKREERLQDVPVPVTAISGSTLTENNLVSVEDYYSLVPGLNLSTGTRGELFLSIRGLTTGTYTSPTVGFVVDDVPYGSSTTFMSAPDIDPNDLASVEVLRGPQGTLYGASSLGGLIKYVTVDPSTSGYSGRVEAGISSVYNGAEPGYNVRAAVNMPISDTLAIRASAFTREDPGYIDNPVLHINGINEGHIYGGRLSALWTPSETVSLKLGATVQHSQQDGNSYVFTGPGFADLQQDYVRGAGVIDRDTAVFNATLKVKLGVVDLTSVTGFADSRFFSTLDFFLLNSYTQTIYGVSGLLYEQQFENHKFSQEVRVSMPVGDHVDLLLGGFYTHEIVNDDFNFTPVNPVSGVPAGVWGRGYDPFDYEEYAAFADATVHVTDRVNVQVGGRASHVTASSLESISTGGFASTLLGADPSITPAASATSRPVTYMLTPQFKVSHDLMTYVRLASGFRPGGSNDALTAAEGLPGKFGPDKTYNYEAGIKGMFLDKTASFDASVYRVNWKNIQALLYPSNDVGGYTANVGEAKSQGIELSAEIRPLTGLSLAGWFDYDDAVLTKTVPASSGIIAQSGDRLPFASRTSGNLSITQQFPVAVNMTGLLGGTLVYVGDRKGDFEGPPPAQRLDMPSYIELDLRAGLKFGTWSSNLIATNVTDKRGLLNQDMNHSNAFMYTKPRTIGLTVAKEF